MVRTVSPVDRASSPMVKSPVPSSIMCVSLGLPVGGDSRSAVRENLRDILDAAARGVLPPTDGRTTVVPQACDRDAGVLAFTAHTVVFTDEDPDWVHETLRAVDCDALAAPM